MSRLFLELSIGLLLVVAFNDSKRPKFRKDYRYEQAFDSFYKLHFSAVSWYHGRMRCEAEGTNLIVPDTLDETDSMPLLITPILNKFDGVYIGVHDLYSERSFVTIKGDTIQDTILDLIWELKEPIHSGGRCVAMRRTGKLFVYPCSKPLPFACKIKASDIMYYPDCDTFDPRWRLGPNDTCYIVHVEPQNWHEAFATCYSAGGHLAALNTRAEAEYIRELFKHSEQPRAPDQFAFLGFHDLFQRYHYRTVQGDKLDVNEVSWEFKCPGEFSKQFDDRCGGLRRSGLLATGPCNMTAMFFCEKPAKNSNEIQKTLRHLPSVTPNDDMDRDDNIR